MEISNRPLSFPPSSLLCFSPPPCRAPTPATWRAFTAASCSRWRPRVALLLLPRLLPRVGASPAVPHAPPSAEPPARPPPRRRRGEPAAAPQGLISCAHEHYFYPRKLFLSSFRLFRAPPLQNAAAAPLELRRAHPAIDPPPQTRSTHANPTIRFASS